MIRPDIQAIGAKWISELRLQDRIIAVRYTKNLCDPLGNLVYGLMTIQNLDEGRFLIEVQDPSTWPVGGSRELSAQSIEEGIVHELVHIRWIDLTTHNPDPAAIVQEERATWATARALVRANSTTRAAIVRAMAVKQRALVPKQLKSRNMAMDPETAKLLLDASESDDAAAMKQAIRKIVEDALTGGGDKPAPASEPAPMPQGAGDGMEPEKDKMPMGYDPKMARAMKAELDGIRSMRAEIAQYRDEAKVAADMLRPKAKEELVRAMRADGIELTPNAEKQIIEAPTLEVAKERAAGMRAMHTGGAPRKQAQQATGDTSGLTRAQTVKYERMVSAGNPRAETFRDECIRENAKKGGTK